METAGDAAGADLAWTEARRRLAPRASASLLDKLCKRAPGWLLDENRTGAAERLAQCDDELNAMILKQGVDFAAPEPPRVVAPAVAAMVAPLAYARGADLPLTNRGETGTRRFRGDESRRRRGRRADLPAETSRGGAAAATWIFR